MKECEDCGMEISNYRKYCEYCANDRKRLYIKKYKQEKLNEQVGRHNKKDRVRD